MANLYIKNFPDDLYEVLKDMAEKRGKSVKEVVVEALNVYIAGSRASAQSPENPEIESLQEPKLTILKYEAKCARCGKKIPAGQEAYLSKVKYVDGSTKWLAWHFECMVTDRQLVKLYVKKREMERIIRALKKRADELADAVSEAETRRRLLEVAEKLEKMAAENDTRYTEVLRVIKEYVFDKGEREKLLDLLHQYISEYEDFRQSLAELAQRLEEIAAAMGVRIQPIKAGVRA